MLLALDKLHPDDEGSSPKVFKKVCVKVEEKEDGKCQCPYLYCCNEPDFDPWDEYESDDEDSYKIDVLFQ